MNRFIVISALLMATACASDRTKPDQSFVIHTIGDSTMAEKRDDRRPETGWGECIARHLRPDAAVSVRNHAVNGRSTKSFIAEGRWDSVLDSLRPGDYVFIQFGHNDNKPEDSTRFTNASTIYKENLRRYVSDTRARKATPVLLTSIVRRNFNESGVLVDTHGGYPDAMRQVAAELGVTLVDAQLLTEKLVLALGPDSSRSLYMHLAPTDSPNYPDGRADDTHLKTAGAERVAALIINDLKTRDARLAAVFE